MAKIKDITQEEAYKSISMLPIFFCQEEDD
jgi:hypothetical protein